MEVLRVIVPLGLLPIPLAIASVRHEKRRLKKTSEQARTASTSERRVREACDDLSSKQRAMSQASDDPSSKRRTMPQASDDLLSKRRAMPQASDDLSSKRRAMPLASDDLSSEWRAMSLAFPEVEIGKLQNGIQRKARPIGARVTTRHVCACPDRSPASGGLRHAAEGPLAVKCAQKERPQQRRDLSPKSRSLMSNQPTACRLEFSVERHG